MFSRAASLSLFVSERRQTLTLGLSIRRKSAFITQWSERPRPRTPQGERRGVGDRERQDAPDGEPPHLELILRPLRTRHELQNSFHTPPSSRYEPQQAWRKWKCENKTSARSELQLPYFGRKVCKLLGLSVSVNLFPCLYLWLILWITGLERKYFIL